MTTKLPIDPNNLPVNTGNLYPPVLLTGLTNNVEYTVTIIAHLADGTTITESRTVKPHADPAPNPPTILTKNGLGLTGTGIPGYSIKLYDSNGDLVTEVEIDSNGNWSIPTALFPGGTTVGFTGSLTVTDINGNESSPTMIDSIDSIPPTSPTIITANGSGLSGTAEPGATVYLLDANGNIITSVLVDSTGHWFIPAASFPNGVVSPFTGSIKVVDPAGNESAIVNINLNVDITPPFAPIPTVQNATGLNGIAEAGSTVNLLDSSGNIIASVVADNSGFWTIPASSFPNGATNGFNGSIVSVDAAGNISTPTTIHSIDGVAPNPPVITTANASKLSGTAEANTTIKLYNSSSVLVATTITDPLGNWVFTPDKFPGGVTDAFTGTVTASDIALNESTATPVPTIDGLAPNPPVITIANASGLFGTAEPNAVIRMYNSIGILVNGTTADNSGNWSILPTRFPGNATNGYTGYLTQTDLAGNTSNQTTIPAIDGIAPNAPVYLIANYYGINGTAEPGSRISLKNSTGIEVATTYTDMNGNWTIPSNSFPGQATNGFTGSVTSLDLAGNESVDTPVSPINGVLPTANLTNYTDNVGSIQSNTSTAATTDDTTPGINIGSGITDTPKLYIGGVLTAATYDSVTGTLTPTVALIDGTYNFTYTLTDSIGNISLPSPVLTITVDTVAPATPSKPSSYNDDVGSITSSISTVLTTDDTTPGINIGRSYTRDHGISDWYCFVSGTATYSISETNISIFQKTPTGVVTKIVNASSSPVRGTIAVTAGYTYYGNGPIHLTVEDAQQSIAPISMAYTTFAYIANRAGSENGIVYFYAPYSTATVTMYKGGSGVTGTSVSSITLAAGQQGSFPITELNWYYFVSTASVVGTAAQVVGSPTNGTDKTILSPVKLTNYQRYINYYTTVNGTTPTTVGNYVIADTTHPVISQNIADGSGTDTAQGLAYEYLCDSYCWGNVLSDYVIVSPEPTNTVVTSYWNGTAWVVWDTHVLAGGSMLSPIEIQRDGTNGPGVTATNINGTAANMATGANLWKWEGTKPFYLCINDSADDEMAMLGWTTHLIAITDTPKLYINNALVTSTYNSSTGTLTPNTALVEGSYDFSYTLTDAAGNESAKSPTYSIVVDLTPPATPDAPTTYVDNVGSITSNTSVAPLTDDTTPGINIGTGLINTPKLYVDGVLTASTYDPITGTLTPNTALVEGVNVITYTLSDAAGNESGQSPSITITVVTTPPTTSAIASYVDNIGSIQCTTSVAISTDDTTPGLNIGTGLTTIPKLYIGGILTAATYNSIIGTLTPNVALSQGTYSFTYTLTDVAGNESLPSAAFSITIDTTAPTTPVTAITSYVDNVGSIQSATSTAIITDDTTPGINIGTGITDTVKLYVNNSQVISTYDSVAGTLTPVYPVAAGTHSFCYTLSDAIGNESGQSPSISITIDITPPTTPNDKPYTYVDNVGSIQSTTSNAATTDDTTPGINIGAGLTNTPKLYVNGTYTPATYVSGTGIITPDSPLSDGLKTITYTLSDVAGNESGQSPAITLTIDTVAPTVSTPTTFLDNVGPYQYPASNLSITDDNRPGINIGTGLTDTVKLYVDGNLTPASYDSSAGTLTPTLAVSDGYHEFAYTLTDIAGNESALSGVKQLTIDTIAPTITSVTPSWGAVLQYSEMLSNGTVTIVSSGAENGSGTSISINGIIYTSTVTNNSSVITIPYADFVNLTNGGTYYINATLTDIAGNSTSNNTVSFTVDSTPSGFISILARDVSTDNEMGWGIALDSSKNKYVMGYGSNRSNLDSPGESHLQIIKYNGAGTIQWHKDTGEINTNSVTYLTLRGFAIDGSGNIYAVGQRYYYSIGSNTTYFTMLIIKVNSSGIFQWSNQLGYTTVGVNNPNDNKFYSIVLDSSANAYVVGISDVNESTLSFDIIIAKYSSSGSLSWKKTLDYGPNPPNAEYGFSIVINSANSYLYAVGHASSDYGYYSATLICYNTTGTLQWQRSIRNAWFAAVTVDSSDDIYVGGFEDSSKTTILCKYNSAGILQKQSYVNGLPGYTANREVLMKLVTYGTTLFFAIGNLVGSIETTTWTLNWVNNVTANSSLIYLANDIKFDTDGNINLSGTFTDGGSIDIGQWNPNSHTNLIGLLVLRVDGSQIGTFTVDQSPFTSVTIANVSGVSLATSGLLPSDGALSEITYTIPSTSVSMTTTDVTSSSSTDTTYISGSQTPLTIPDSPTSVTATALDQRAFVTFTPPINNGGSGITNFTATSNPGNISVTSTSSPIQLTGLTNGTSYTFTVVATNSTGISIPSSASNSVTPVTDTIGSGNNSIGYWLGTAGDGVSKMYVAPKSTERAVAWGSYGSVRGTTSTTNGISNTNTLYARGSAITTGHPAAYYAKVLSTGGYNTWYLPAKDEIATCWTNRFATPFSTANSFLNAAYWSSTEDTNNNAWYQVSTDTKSTPNYIRAVRRSTI